MNTSESTPLNLKAALVGLLTAILVALPCRAQDLAAHWKFDQKGGEFENFVEMGAPAKVLPSERKRELPILPDKIGGLKQVVEFDGLGELWIEAPSELLTDHFTIELWVKVEGGNADALLIGNPVGMMLMARPKGTLAFFLFTGTEWSYVDIPNALPVGEWRHVMARLVDGSQQLFVQNGEEILKSAEIKAAIPDPIPFSATFLGLNVSEHSKPFTGRLGALKIYSGALSEANFAKSEP